MDPIKAGVLSTEFWMTIMTNLAAIFNLFHPMVINNQVLSNIASFLVMASTTVAYIMGRSKVKASSVASNISTTSTLSKIDPVTSDLSPATSVTTTTTPIIIPAVIK